LIQFLTIIFSLVKNILVTKFSQQVMSMESVLSQKLEVISDSISKQSRANCSGQEIGTASFFSGIVISSTSNIDVSDSENGRRADFDDVSTGKAENYDV